MEVKALFHEADTDRSGSLDYDKFRTYISDVRVQAHFLVILNMYVYLRIF